MLLLSFLLGLLVSLLCLTTYNHAFVPPTVVSSSSSHTLQQRDVETSSCFNHQLQPRHSNPRSSRSSSLNAVLNHYNDDESTVVTLTSPSGDTKVTLIGTAHLSQRSNEQVKRIIEEIQPNMVMVELDPTRLHRIGIDNIQDIRVQHVTTSENIALPNDGKNKNKGEDDPFWKNPFQIAQTALVEAFTRISRAMLTGMYNDMSSKMKNNTEGSGGEFLVAIRAAEECSNCQRLVLGDRSSLTTIRRAATLALQSGDPLGVINRLQKANGEEMKELEEKVRNQLVTEKSLSSDAIDESEVQVAMMEALKQDTNFRDRLFRKLEQEVPEFTQAFLKERDYIMSKAIHREISSPEIIRVVGVVGLAHVPGMEANLRAMWKNHALPLEVEATTTKA